MRSMHHRTTAQLLHSTAVLSSIIMLYLTSLVTLAQTPVAKTDKGTLNGAGYIILFPQDWKGKLVMYAHGYEFMGTPVRQSANPDFATRMTPFLEKGYAVAASDYSIQGYAIPQGVEETEALRKHFIKTYGKVDSAFIAGHSMGGGISLDIIENFGKAYHGALALCPLSSKPYLQVRKEFDLYATFNGLFPGIAVSLKEIFDLSNPKPAASFGEMRQRATAMRKAIVAKDSLLGVSFAKRFDLKFDDLPFTLFFDENVLRDIAAKSKGNPFDNTNTVYSGFPDDVVVNEKAERLAATVSPDAVFGKYSPTGNLAKPVVLMHTLYDQLIPVTYAVQNYENLVHERGNSDYFLVKYTNGQGHCAFTPQQTTESFGELRRWVKTGRRGKPGIVK